MEEKKQEKRIEKKKKRMDEKKKLKKERKIILGIRNQNWVTLLWYFHNKF